jgi:hypothetical protein
MPSLQAKARANQNPYIEEEQTTQWPKEKGQTMIHKTLHRKLKIEQSQQMSHSR